MKLEIDEIETKKNHRRDTNKRNDSDPRPYFFLFKVALNEVTNDFSTSTVRTERRWNDVHRRSQVTHLRAVRLMRGCRRTSNISY